MTLKPTWLTRPKILAFGLALVAAGYFTPIYQIAEQTFGVQETAELFKWIIAAKEEVENPPPANPPTLPTKPDEPPIVVNGDEIDIQGATLFGPHKNKDPSKARVTDTLRSVKIRGDGIVLDYSTSGWPNNDSGVGGNIDGRVYIYWESGGKLVGGHFDWKRPGTKDRSFENIRNGYLDGQQPPRGATAWVVLMTNKGDRRTNVVKVQGAYP